MIAPVSQMILPPGHPGPQREVTGRYTNCGGWLIARLTQARSSTDQRVEVVGYLQLGTGQWCPASAATWFPVQSAAAAYASELVADGKHQIGIVFRRRQINWDGPRQGDLARELS